MERQKKTPITVIIGNPPYNVGQINENDNNKNRKYAVIDRRIKETYAKASKATLNTKLYDPYVKFFRWAIDRLEGRDGIVCLVTNNSFVDQIAFDGMRQHLMQDFTSIYHLAPRRERPPEPDSCGHGLQCLRHSGRSRHYYRDPTRSDRSSIVCTFSVSRERCAERKNSPGLPSMKSCTAVDWQAFDP